MEGCALGPEANANQLMTKVLVDGEIDFIGFHLIEALTGEGYPDLFDLA
jgi:hypothetical protein